MHTDKKEIIVQKLFDYFGLHGFILVMAMAIGLLRAF